MVIFDSSLVTDAAVAVDAKAAIEVVAASGLRAGLLTSEYVTAVCEREDQYPTGLPTTSSVGVAVPHATPTEEGQPAALFVARLSAAVRFREMGSESGTVDVRLVFLLSVPGKDHLGLLGALARMFQDDAAMHHLVTASRHDIAEQIRANLTAAGITVEGLP